MDPDENPAPALHELRILVLHNRDFASSADDGPARRPAMAPGDEGRGETAGADVVNAAQHVARALCARGHFVEVQGVDQQDVAALLGRLSEDPPDLVFNLCESLGGDARNEIVLPSLLDMLHIPYTGTGPLGLGLALHKDRAKEILRGAGVPTPPGVTLPEAGRRAADLRQLRAAGLAYPLMLKPAHEDASVGISAASVVRSDDELCAQLAALRAQHAQPVLCERFIDGRELYVSFIGNDPPRALPMTEIDFSGLPAGEPRVLGYEAKWSPGSALYEGTRSGPAAPLPREVEARVVAAALGAAAALRLRDYGRCDLRLDGDGEPYVIDVNPNCDLSDGAGFSLAARQGGLAYDALIERIAAAALTRSDHARRRAPLVSDPAAAAARAGGAPRARGEGRPVLAGRGELRPGAHRQRAV